MHILSIDWKKKPFTNFGKSSRGRLRGLETFEGTHILGASRGRLCDSKAFLYYLIFVLKCIAVSDENYASHCSELSQLTSRLLMLLFFVQPLSINSFIKYEAL